MQAVSVHLLDALAHALLQHGTLVLLILELGQLSERSIQPRSQLLVVRLQLSVVLPENEEL